MSISGTAARRDALRSSLLAAAQRTIAAQGFEALRARALADEVGCAVGAIYNVFSDLDGLVIAVNSRTLADLEQALLAAAPEGAGHARDADEAIARMIRMALAYTDFAAVDTLRWRAVFNHSMSGGQPVPEWYRAEQRRLFGYLDAPVRALRPQATHEERALLTRSVFSAVHGIVVLGLEETLGVMPLPVLRRQVTLLVDAMGRGLSMQDAV
jgi:AcrR family transcriptional regulator